MNHFSFIKKLSPLTKAACAAIFVGGLCNRKVAAFVASGVAAYSLFRLSALGTERSLDFVLSSRLVSPFLFSEKQTVERSSSEERQRVHASLKRTPAPDSISSHNTPPSSQYTSIIQGNPRFKGFPTIPISVGDVRKFHQLTKENFHLVCKTAD